MPKRLLFFFVVAAGILGASQLAVIITTMSPYEADPHILALFYGSLWTVLTSFGTLLLFGIRYRVSSRFREPRLHVCLRQAALAAAVASTCLALQSYGILSWWEVVPLVSAAILIEFFFQADTSKVTA